MSGRITEHLRSNVVGYVAIFLFAIGGTAYATHPGGANTISTGDIINGEVKTADIGNNEVTDNDTGPNSVNTGDIVDGAVTQAEITEGAVRSGEIANNKVQSVDLFDGAVTSADVLDNTLGTADLGTGSVGSDEITDDTVTGADLAGSGFGSDGFNGDEEIIDGTILGFDIAGGTLGGFHIGDGSLTGADIADDSLTSADGLPTAGANHNASVFTLPGGGAEVVSAAITLEKTATVIVNGVAELEGAEGDERVQCTLRLDGSGISLGYESTFDDIGTSNEASIPANAFATGVAPGAHTVSMFCSPLAGTIVKDDAGINAIAIP